MDEGDRETHSKLGREAELRVAARLRDIYGERRVISDGPRATGTKGKPDVLIITDPPILVEVKTCQLFHKKRLWGVAKTFIPAWERLTLYAQTRLLSRVLVIEFRHKGAYVYLWLPGEAVDKLLEEKLAKNPDLGIFHMEFREALERGHILSDRGFDLEPVVSSQKRMDGFMNP